MGKKRSSSAKNVLTTVTVLVAAFASGLWTISHQQAPSGRPTQIEGQQHRVAYVSDGDTIKLDNGQKVRLIGIDTPETHDNVKLTRDVSKRHSSRSAQLQMGEEAAAFVRKFLQGKDVRLEFDVEQHDRYGRLLAYVYLSDGTFVNEKIIREGYAYPLTIPPNVRHAEQFKIWFDEARDNRRGLWR
jgi:micrococcal nuclease